MGSGADGSGKALAIGAAVGLLSKFLVAGGISGRAAVWASLLITTIAVAIFAYSSADFHRETVWPYFLLWCEVLVNAAGAFHLIEETQRMKPPADR